MGYARFSLKEISRALRRRGGTAGAAVSAFHMQKRKIAHGASLAYFLVF
jgi:hypothetical protein